MTQDNKRFVRETFKMYIRISSDTTLDCIGRSRIKRLQLELQTDLKSDHLYMRAKSKT